MSQGLYCAVETTSTADVATDYASHDVCIPKKFHDVASAKPSDSIGLKS